MTDFLLVTATDEPVTESTSISPSGFSHSFNHRGESFSSELVRRMVSLLSLAERSVNRVTSLEVVELTSEAEPTASPDGSKNLSTESTWPLVLLGNVVLGVSSVTFQGLVISSSEKPLVVPSTPSVTCSKSAKNPPAVVTSV